MGTNNGLNKLDQVNGGFTRYQTVQTEDGTVSLGMIRTLYKDKRGNFWIGTEEQGLFHFDFENELFTRYVHEPGNPTSISGNAIFSIVEDQSGKLWVGTGSDGVNILDRDNGVFLRYQQSNENPFSINRDSITEIYVSSEGVVWIGTKLLKDGKTFTKQGTAGEKGTELGFDLCKDFVNKNGGTIKVESKEGVGTTIRFAISKEKIKDPDSVKQKSIRERYFSTKRDK